MKKLIVLLILLAALSLTLSGQRNAVGLTFQPQDLGVGIIYTNLGDLFGYYGSASWGNYTMGEGLYINDHYKIAGGLLIRIKGEPSFVSVGIIRSFYGEKNVPVNLNPATLEQMSIEFGVGIDVDRLR
jgi:hypothetical protein